MNDPIYLDSAQIKNNIPDPLLRENLTIQVVPELSSTHQVLNQQLLNAEITLPRVLLAEYQTAAIGQRAKKWHATRAENIYFSYACMLNKKLRDLEGLSLIVGLAVARTLSECGLLDIKVKWPNDVYAQGKKITGILLATDTGHTGQIGVIISLGLNVNMTGDANMIQQPWTSMRLMTGKNYDRNKILGILITQLSSYLNLFLENGFEHFLSQWQENDFLAAKTIILKSGETLCEGIVQGVNSRGHLMLRNAQGEINAYASAEIVK